MRIVDDVRVVAFVAETIGCKFSPPFQCLGIERGGKIVSGAVFAVYERTDIHVSVAGSFFTKGFLSDVGQYVYGQLGCLRATILTEDPKVVKLAERLGGKVEGALRSHFGEGRDAYIVGILRSEYRF